MGASDIEMPFEPAGTLVFRLGYDGARFSGFAEQPGQLTVAGEVRRALETFMRREIDLTCAGRTDAGVHAISQYVSVPALASELEVPGNRWMRAMAALLPDDIALASVHHAAPGFSARFDARSRTYTYRIATGEARPLITRRFAWWHRAPLDVEAMERAAACLVGEHDFKSFCKVASTVGKPTCRNVHAVSFARAAQMGEELIEFTITGNAFLHSMVRTIVGSLVEVGTGRRDPRWLADALAACDRLAAGPTAPAQGLCFMGVEYDEGALAPCPDMVRG
ncbi:MAG: tRNA pseudouridine(38-40) synthase TruA [Collinsella sp.]|nr:tRNA pseudouridine(38-40) synthase TruA [Collinsella sp.]